MGAAAAAGPLSIVEAPSSENAGGADGERWREGEEGRGGGGAERGVGSIGGPQSPSHSISLPKNINKDKTKLTE